MSKEKKVKEYFKFSEINKTPIIESSTNISPYSLDISKPKKINELQKSKILLKSENISTKSPINEHHNLKDNNKNIVKNILINLQKKLQNINHNININNRAIEKIKNSLNKLKLEKNKKKSDIVNLLSNKESLDEIYNNYIDYLKNKNKGNKITNKKFNNIKSNPLDNQDEDAFEILISEIKEIDLNKFIEQTFNLIEEIFENPNQQLKLSLKEIINKSYSLFNSAITSSPFLDTYSIVSNFFLRISLFLSNQSNGKYSETIINLFLRCLLKMNSINVKNENLINYMNTKYKEEKGKMRQEIGVFISKNEILNKTKIFVEKQIKEIEFLLKSGKNIGQMELDKINYNINYINNYNCNDPKFLSNNKNNDDRNYAYCQTEIKNENNNYGNNISYKKTEIKEKLNKFKKIYKEDMIEIGKNEDLININNAYNSENLKHAVNIKESKSKNTERKAINNNNKLYDNFMDKINTINLNDKFSTNLNDIKKENNEHFTSNQSYNNKIKNKNKKEKEIDDKELLIKNMENNIKKYNTINNYHDISKKNIIKKEYISPQINNKNHAYYKNNILNDENMKNSNNKVLERIYYNKKFKVTNKQPKKKLNYHYYTKKVNNNIISYNDINKNMKCDLEKKIKYLDKVNNNNSSNKNSNIKSKNISSKYNKDKIKIEHNFKYKRLLTEKKEKKFKYNFFDIIQETNKKRNNSGENKYKNINILNSSNNYRNSINSKNEKDKLFISNDNIKKFKLNTKNYEFLVKSDVTNDRTKSYYDKNNFQLISSNSKYIKNGIESENNYNNGSDSTYNKYDLSFSNKNKIGGEKNRVKASNILNKNQKYEINTINKINLLNNRNQFYHFSKNTDDNSGKKDKCSDKNKFQTFKKEKTINKILNKEFKKNNIYFIITETKSASKYNNRFIAKYKYANLNDHNSNSKSNRSEISKNKNLNKGYNSCCKPKNKISNFNFNYKFNKTLLLKRTLSSTLNKLFNNNLRKKNLIDSYNDNNSSSNNSFNVSNSLGVSYINNNKKQKEINSNIQNANKTKINKEAIANLKIGLKNSVEINKDNNKKKNKKLNNIINISSNNLTGEDYKTNLNKFKQNQKETFCYFKIFDKDFKNNKKFNPLDNCSINPENIGYTEGYISFNLNKEIIKITPKIIEYSNNNNFKKSNIENELLLKINEINSNLKQYNKYDRYSKNKVKDFWLNIGLKNVIDIDQTFIMNNIIKIHRIFIKYNSGQKNNNINSTNNSQKIDKKALNLNKLIYVREIKEINMPQNEKIKAILCNYFSFSFLFGDKNKTEIELIFINFEQYNLWYKFFYTIIDLNKKYKIKYDNEANNKDYTHTKGNIENGSNVNEDMSKLSNNDNDIILNI